MGAAAGEVRPKPAPRVDYPPSPSPSPSLLKLCGGRISGDRAVGTHHERVPGPTGCVGVLCGLVGVASGDAASPERDEQRGGREDGAHYLGHVGLFLERPSCFTSAWRGPDYDAIHARPISVDPSRLTAPLSR